MVEVFGYLIIILFLGFVAAAVGAGLLILLGGSLALLAPLVNFIHKNMPEK